jgi:hypothetical protein
MTANAGYYKDPNATRLFYRKVAQEIDLACADGYYVYLVIAMAWTSLPALLLIVSRFRRVRLSNPLVVTLILLGAAIVSRLIFFSFLDATWWMDGYERYIFPIMPMTSCFFILLIYQAIAIWRNRSGFPTPVSNQC